MFAGALISAYDALDVLLIGFHVQTGVAATARALGTVGLRVWCHAVGRLLLLLQFLLGHHGRRGRDEGAQGRQVLIRGDTGANRRQVR